MKKALLIAVVMVGAASALFGLEVGAMFNIGDLAFNPNRLPTDTSFPGTYYPWGISLDGSAQLSDNLRLDSGITYNDPVLRNIAFTTVTYQGNYFQLGAGPLFGFFNSATTPLSPGLSVSATIQLPGVVFFTYRGDSTLAGALVQTGDYLQQRSQASLGYYVPNAIVSANLVTEKYSEKTSAGNTIDQRTEYSLKTDIYEKAIPYRVLLSFGYQTLAKTFVQGGTTTVDQLGSLILGTRVEFHATHALVFVADLRSSIYTFGQKALVGLSNPGPNGYLFQLTTGVRLTLPGAGAP